MTKMFERMWASEYLLHYVIYNIETEICLFLYLAWVARWFTRFCETQWRHSVKTRLYNTPPPYFILWNAVTSLGENKTPLPILHCITSVKT